MAAAATLNSNPNQNFLPIWPSIRPTNHIDLTPSVPSPIPRNRFSIRWSFVRWWWTVLGLFEFILDERQLQLKNEFHHEITRIEYFNIYFFLEFSEIFEFWLLILNRGWIWNWIWDVYIWGREKSEEMNVQQMKKKGARVYGCIFIDGLEVG